MDKKTVKMVLIIIGLIIAMAILEISIRAIGSSIKSFSEKKQEEKKQEELYNSETSVQSRETEKFVNNVYDAIQNKQYEVVYNLLDATYKECFFENNLTNFKDYLENEMILGNEYKIVRINQKTNYAEVLVGITSGEDYKTQICVVKTANGDNKIIFGQYSNITKAKETNADTENVRYNLEYYFEVATQGVFVVKATNKTEKELSLNLSNACLETTGGQRKNGEITETIKLLPKASAEIKIVYNKTKYSLNHLSFIEKQNGKSENVYMLLDEIFGIDEE